MFSGSKGRYKKKDYGGACNEASFDIPDDRNYYYAS